MILYESNETEFKSLGICNLSDSLTCTVTQDMGHSELEMTYPIDSDFFGAIKHRRIIFCKTSPHAKPQPFRIYGITTPINRVITINAAHIHYDLSGYIVEPYTADSAKGAIDYIKTHMSKECPFTFSTDIREPGEIDVKVPKSIKALLANHISPAYKPEYYFDKFHVYCNTRRGKDTDINVIYGKNMIDFKQEENIDNIYTAVYPYWYSEDPDHGGLVTLKDKVIKTQGHHDFTRIFAYDLSSEFTNKPTQEQLTSATSKYIEKEKLGTPKVSIDVSFLQLSNSVEYSQRADLDKVEIGDSMTVTFEDAGINTKARCIKTVYDAKSNRYVTLELGDGSKTLSEGLIDNNRSIDAKIEKSANQTKKYADNSNKK